MRFTFGDFELDTDRCELRQAGERRHLEPQVYAVLCFLLENRHRLVGKNELLDHVWGHRFVTPATLNTRIKALRQALGDNGSAQRIVETVRGRGFRIRADLAIDTSSTSTPAAEGPSAPIPSDPQRALDAEAVHGGTSGGVEQRIRFRLGPDGVRIAYATSGSGPPLVKTANWLTHLDHDWNSPIWRHWLTELSRDHTLIRYDERGCGLSDHDAADLSFEAWLRDLGTVVDELGLERFPLFGLSQGCAVAVAYAARHPERVSRLVLYGGFPLGRFRRDQVDREEEEMILRLMPLGWGRDNPAFRQFFARMFLPEGTPEQLRWFSDLQRLTTSPENAVRLRSTSAKIDVCDLAPQVRAPALVLHATGDAVVPLAQGRLLAALIPSARFVALQSNNHILLKAEPAWANFLEEVRAFLASDEEQGVTRAERRSASTPLGAN